MQNHHQISHLPIFDPFSIQSRTSYVSSLSYIHTHNLFRYVYSKCPLPHSDKRHKYHIYCVQEMCRNVASNWTWCQWRTMLLKRKLERNYWQLLLYNTWLPLFIPLFVELRAVLIMSADAKCSLCFWMRLCLVSTVLMKTLSCTLPHISNTWLWGICLSHPRVAFCLSLCISFFSAFPPSPLFLLASLPLHLSPLPLLVSLPPLASKRCITWNECMC